MHGESWVVALWSSQLPQLSVESLVRCVKWRLPHLEEIREDTFLETAALNRYGPLYTCTVPESNAIYEHSFFTSQRARIVLYEMATQGLPILSAMRYQR
jgi:hypothetical protein